MLFKSSTLRFEITVALIIKVMLFVGLWFIIFRFPGHPPGERPDIAAQLLAPGGLQPAPADFPTSDSSETSHVRR